MIIYLTFLSVIFAFRMDSVITDGNMTTDLDNMF